MSDVQVLIAGAGPTGLAAALFLSHLGVKSRIVDPKHERSKTSNALGVNPRSLDLLESTGVSEQIVKEGLAMTRFTVHQYGNVIGQIKLEPQGELGAKHPMIVLPQWRTEELLTQALDARGIVPERGLALVHLDQDDDGVNYRLIDAHGREEEGRVSVLFGADGAHSKVRKLLNFDFHGSAYPEEWTIVDATLDVPGGPCFHIDFRTEGIFLAIPYSATNWRLIGFVPDLINHLPKGWILKSVEWTSNFRISHRIASALSKGRVCLGGDAAHIHAPVGARGMNLGIEDAYVFAHCVADFLNGKPERLDDYGRIRHETDAAVVRKIEMFTKAARATGWLVQSARRVIFALVMRFPWIFHRLQRMTAGLDHEVRLS